MRKIVAGLFMSLDGVVESPESWGFQYFNEAMTQEIAEGIGEADAVLMGRRTYLQFAALWPEQGSDVPMADFLNNTPKYVVSSTLGTLEWGPASLVKGDLAEELLNLKQQPGKNIQIPGSPVLVRSLLRDGLLDELSLTIVPIVVGAGMRLFEGVTDQIRLELVQSHGFSTGGVSATYRPADAGRLVSEQPVDFPDAAARG
jgi:dihydrofolate reductase